MTFREELIRFTDVAKQRLMLLDEWEKVNSLAAGNGKGET